MKRRRKRGRRRRKRKKKKKQKRRKGKEGRRKVRDKMITRTCKHLSTGAFAAMNQHFRMKIHLF